MRLDAGVFCPVSAVVFYSNTGESRAIAAYLANKLGYRLAALEEEKTEKYQNLVLVFPVYCQNIPRAVAAFLKKAEAQCLAVIAAYGKMHHGNVLYEIQTQYRKAVVAGAYVPTRHAYIEDDEPFSEFDLLMPLVEKLRAPSPAPVLLPRLRKNLLASLFPEGRSRIGLKIQKSGLCDGCNACAALCPLGAMQNGTPSRRCIRCLRCVTLCPRQALEIKLGLPLKLYLRKKKKDEIILYL